MASVTLRNVVKWYPGNVRAAWNVNLMVKEREFFVLVGPSGCGKSTTLRIIAGLEEATSGEVLIDGRCVNDLPSRERDVAMVFQNYTLYPHLTVYENIAFGLRLRRFPRDEIDRRVRRAARILHIGDVLGRRPHAVSGGQRQRAALGRAIVREPKVFLFDEPLSNMDARLRLQMRTELSKLHNLLQATIIYVTHDQEEAMTLGQRVAVMDRGAVQQTAEPMLLYHHPVNRFVAGFVGTPPMNFLPCDVTRRESETTVSVDRVQLPLPARLGGRFARGTADRTRYTLGIRPEDIVVEGSTGERTLESRAEIIEPLGSHTLLYFSVAGYPVVVSAPPHVRLRVGETAHLRFLPERVHIFHQESGIGIV